MPPPITSTPAGSPRSSRRSATRPSRREVRERIKLLILDSLGCAIYGANLEWCRILQTTLAALDTTRTTSIWGTAGSLSSPHAALVNGTQVQGFELDDVHRHGVLHVGAVTLAGADRGGGEPRRPDRPGLSHRRGRRLRDRPARRQVHGRRSTSARAGIPAPRSASTPPPPARRAACGCRAEQTVHALGIAGTQSAGLMAAQYGAMVKRMHAGRASQSGLYGALLAKQRLHRHRRRVRGALRRLLHDLLALARPLQPERAQRRTWASGSRPWASRSSSIPAWAAITPRSTPSATSPGGARSRPATSSAIVVHGSQVTVDHVGWPYRARGAHLGAAQPAVLRRHAADRGRRVRRPVHDRRRSTTPPASRCRARSRSCTTPPSPRSAPASATRCASRCISATARWRPRRARRRAAASSRSRSSDEIVEKFRKLTRAAMGEPQQDALIDAVLGLEKLEDAGQLARLMRVG